MKQRGGNPIGTIVENDRKMFKHDRSLRLHRASTSKLVVSSNGTLRENKATGENIQELLEIIEKNLPSTIVRQAFVLHRFPSCSFGSFFTTS